MPLRLPAQGQLLLLAMQLMRGGSLRAALLHPELKRRLAWSARQVQGFSLGAAC